MNIQMRDITVTAREGRVSHVDKIYVRGSHIKLFVVPDMLKNAPMFKQRERTQQGQDGDKDRRQQNNNRGQGQGRQVQNLVEKGRSRR